MNLRDEKVMLMQSHKKSSMHRQTQTRDPKVTSQGSYKCFIKAWTEPRSLSQRIVSVGPTWLSQEGGIAWLTCQYAHVKIHKRQDYRFQSQQDEWDQWQQAQLLFFPLRCCYELLSVGRFHYVPQFSFKGLT